MGRCSVLDYNARTRWHIPLVENVHYLSSTCNPIILCQPLTSPPG